MSNPPFNKILIIDGDENISITLSKFLADNEFEVYVEDSVQASIDTIRNKKIDLVVTDFDVAKYTGIEILKKVKVIDSSIQVIIVTAYQDIRLAVQALKKGAYDYVVKPLYTDEILGTINEALETRQDLKYSPQRKSKTKKEAKPLYIIGPSYQSQLVEKHINLIAPTDMSVIISGETGTGKEYVARSIHEKSKRAKMPFVAVDCGAMSSELAGSELFGHVKGAFTGAITDRKGCFERAHGGTLFLDEIGNLSYDNQVQLLRALQEGAVNPVGGSKEVLVNVRVLVASNDDLRSLVESNEFREDIFHRLNEFRIDLAPLRKRPDDIEVFAQHFLKLANKKLDKKIQGFEPEVLAKFKTYDWPGNLRELRNIVRRCVLISTGNKIDQNSPPGEISALDSNIDFEQNRVLNSDTPISLKKIVEQAERGAIIQVLKQTNFNKTKTAELLQVDRKTLYNKMRALNISDENN